MAWESLLVVDALNRQALRDFRDLPPLACPRDGWPLQDKGDGKLLCVFDGWEYPRDWVIR